MYKVLNRCENVLTYSAAVSTFMMMCLTTFDAAGRYLFNHPISGAYEITESYLAVATVFLGIGYAYRGGAFIRVSFFVDRMPKGVKLMLNYFVQVFSILLSISFLIATTLQAYRKFASGITLSFLPFPLWPAYIIVFLGFFFTTLLMVLDLWRIRTGESDLFKEESPTA